VATKHPVDAVGRDLDPAPLEPSQLIGDVLGTGAGMGQGKAEDAHLDVRRRCIRHPRTAALSWPEQLETVAVRSGLPAVVGGSVDPGVAARLCHIAQFLSQSHYAQT
jgi:hypothetical protein